MSTSEKNTINYNGMELPCIESGYWPNGVTLVGANVRNKPIVFGSVLCLCKERILTNQGSTTQMINWAILPPKPAARRLTNREVYALWRKGWDICNRDNVLVQPCYSLDVEDHTCTAPIKLRAPNSDEWLEPTSDLLEVAK